MKRQLTIHFNAATTAKICESLPDFKCQVFEDVKATRFDSGFLKVVVASRENTVDGLAEYYYNADTIGRIKVIDLPE